MITEVGQISPSAVCVKWAGRECISVILYIVAGLDFISVFSVLLLYKPLP